MGTKEIDKAKEKALGKIDKIELDDASKAEIKEEVESFADKAKEEIPDTLIYRIIVTALAVVAFTALIGAIVLVAQGKTSLDALIALGSASVGALAGALLPQKQG